MNNFEKNYNGFHNVMPLMVMSNGQVVYKEQTQSSKMEHCLQSAAWETDDQKMAQIAQVLLALAVSMVVLAAGLFIL